MQPVQQYIHENKGRFLEELLELLRIPSISADPAYKGEVRRAAEYVAESLRKSGADRVEIIETGGHPVVYGEKITAVSYTHLTLPTNREV